MPALPASLRGAVLGALTLASSACALGRRVGDEVVTTVKVAEVSFEFRTCTRRRDILTCTVMVANEGRDAKLFLERKDVKGVADGVDLPVAAVRFAGSLVQEVNAEIQNGVPRKLEVDFANSRDIGERLRLLEFDVSLFERQPTGEWTKSLLGDDLTRPVRFRNVKVD
ncbi:MAG: hypothetical protein HY275_03310 [Gemmatimonadetes bacterium]|nr:hypothetical protein [Gemmatimonadota bacterium]